MTTLTIGQTYNLLRSAGFTPAQAVDMTGIAIAESGLRTDAIGDVGLETSTYGPSVGLFQIRTVKAQNGTGGQRDQSALLASPKFQAQMAYEISNGGKNFSPWSTWLHGSAQAQLGKVYAALGVSNGSQLPGSVAAPGVPDGSSSSGGATASNAGLISTPLGWLGDLLGVSGVEQSAVKVVLFGGVLIGGVALFVLGAWRTVGPTVQGKADDAKSAATTAIQMGALA